MGLEFLLPLAIQYAPWISKMIFGGAADQTVSVLVDVAKKVFGTTDEAAIKRQLAESTAKAEMFNAELEARRGELEAILGDVQSARAQTVELAKAGSGIAWGAPVVSVVVTLGFLGFLTLYFTGQVPSETGIASLLVGTLAAGFTQTVNYWLGSSAGSQKKDVLLANSVPVNSSNARPQSRPVLRREA